MYDNKLTKNDLLKAGIINVSADGLHITGIIRDFKQTPSNSGHLNCLGMPVHRIVYTWFHGESPEGLVIDHINNIKTDNRIENLQAITPGENIWKDREHDIVQIKCQLSKPRSFYENKLEGFIIKYEQAKIEGNSKAAHKLRSNISMTKARLRYWDANAEEHDQINEQLRLEEEAKQQYHKNADNKKKLAEYKKLFKELKNKPMWRQIITVSKQWDSLEQTKQDEILKKLSDFVANYPQQHC